MKKALLIMIVSIMIVPAMVFGAGSQDGGAATSAVVNPAGTFPIVDEKVTLTFFARKT